MSIVLPFRISSAPIRSREPNTGKGVRTCKGPRLHPHRDMSTATAVVRPPLPAQHPWRETRHRQRDHDRNRRGRTEPDRRTSAAGVRAPGVEAAPASQWRWERCPHRDGRTRACLMRWRRRARRSKRTSCPAWEPPWPVSRARRSPRGERRDETLRRLVRRQETEWSAPC
jgi:hypothetical protein